MGVGEGRPCPSHYSRWKSPYNYSTFSLDPITCRRKLEEWEAWLPPRSPVLPRLCETMVRGVAAGNASSLLGSVLLNACDWDMDECVGQVFGVRRAVTRPQDP